MSYLLKNLPQGQDRARLDGSAGPFKTSAAEEGSPRSSNTLNGVRPLAGQLRSVQDALDALARRHQVPGATLAIGLGDEVFDFATGVVNVDTGVETTTDSVFQIGSITKPLTTTLVMQLVDAGQVKLDDPVIRYLPDFALADRTAASQITVRHLLTHTSGIQGDHFQSFGRGDDAIEKYVASLADIDLVHRPGQFWSYCNAGFVVAGRLTEVVTGSPFCQLVKEQICRPLGLEQTTVLLEDTVTRRCAVGHVPGPGGKPVIPATVVLDYSGAPAGHRTTSSASDLVRFAQMHLNSGTGPDGGQVLSASSAAAMQQVQLSKPATSTSPLAQGLGWALQEWGGKQVVGHGGMTIGQISSLHAVPEERLVLVLLTNSSTGGKLWLDLGSWLFEGLAGLKMATVPEPPPAPPRLPLARYTGTYERLGVRQIVAQEGGCLVMRTEITDQIPPELRPLWPLPREVKLRPIDHERFAARLGGVNDVVMFLEFEAGRPGYLFFAGRAARRKVVTSRQSPRPLVARGTRSQDRPPSDSSKASATKAANSRSG